MTTEELKKDLQQILFVEAEKESWDTGESIEQVLERWKQEGEEAREEVVAANFGCRGRSELELPF